MTTPRTEATTLRMKAFTDRDDALACTRTRNGGTRNGRTELWVVVDGPEENEYTVMELADAIDAGFTYEWCAR